ncbi:GGDEF domain-containing protein [Tenacibaculum sp. KUL152]|nr:GGDEF domain-containing protein [Tenacibaculum sp. KUL152]
MKLLLLLAFIFTCSSTAFANDEIENLFDIANRVKSSDIEAFEATVDDIRSRASQLSREQFNHLEYLTGYLYGFKGKPKLAVSHYYNAYNNTQDLDLKVITLMSIVNYRGISRDFHTGYIEAEELFSIINSASDKVRLNANFVLAIFYNLADDNQSSRKIIRQVSFADLDLRQQCIYRSTLLEAEHKLGLIETIEDYERAIETCQNANELILVGMSTLLKSKSLVDSGNINNAAALLQSSEQIFVSSRYPIIIAEFYASYASLLLQLNSTESSISLALKALEQTSLMQASQPRVQAYKTLAEAYEQYGQLDESLKYYKLYAEAEKAFLDETKAKQLAIQQAKIESIEKTNQIALLDKENAVLKAEARAGKEEQLNAQLTAGMLALLALATLMWAYKNRRMHLILRHKAQTDQLTKIANRSHFSAESEQLLKQRKLVKTPVAFIIFDLDFFKQVNDNHGHIVGDWVLTNAVQAVKPLLRATDKFGRMGGEEFAIMLAGCDAQQAMAVAEDCRQAIEAMDCSRSGAAFNVTASFGVADSTQCGYNFDKLYGCADEALYQSKHAGRNRVYLYHPSTQQRAQTLVHA